jgi:pimeloyl-ACP methyl ester carboxylesterase
MDTNPSLVQEARNRPASSIPLVLIHDGGGTTFGYYLLGELHPARELWAIHNPNYKSSRPYPKTMEEIARDYIRMIESSGIHGPIYLGGELHDGAISQRRLLVTQPNKY